MPSVRGTQEHAKCCHLYTSGMVRPGRIYEVRSYKGWLKHEGSSSLLPTINPVEFPSIFEYLGFGHEEGEEKEGEREREREGGREGRAGSFDSKKLFLYTWVYDTGREISSNIAVKTREKEEGQIFLAVARIF